MQFHKRKLFSTCLTHFLNMFNKFPNQVLRVGHCQGVTIFIRTWVSHSNRFVDIQFVAKHWPELCLYSYFFIAIMVFTCRIQYISVLLWHDGGFCFQKFNMWIHVNVGNKRELSIFHNCGSRWRNIWEHSSIARGSAYLVCFGTLQRRGSYCHSKPCGSHRVRALSCCVSCFAV